MQVGDTIPNYVSRSFVWVFSLAPYTPESICSATLYHRSGRLSLHFVNLVY